MPRRKKLTADQWIEIQRLQKASYHGQLPYPTREQTRLMETAMIEDGDRYTKYARQLREEYRNSMRF